MSETTSQCVHATADKLLKALDCLLVENFTIRDKTLLEKLLTSLQNSSVLLKTISIDTHRKWFNNVLVVYQRQTPSSKNSSIHLYAFALKYLAILVNCNDGLVKFIETHTLQSIIDQLDFATNFKEPSVFNAYMILLQTLNTHKQGLEYIFEKGLWKNILYAIHGLITPAKFVEIQSSQYIADLIYRSFEYKMAYCCEPLLKELFSYLDLNDSQISNKRAKEFFAYNIFVKTLILTLEKFVGTQYESDSCQQIIFKHSVSDVLGNIQKLLNIAPMLLKNYVTLHLLFDYFTVWHQSNMEYILKLIFALTNISKDVQSYKKINSIYMQAIRYASISNIPLVVNTEFEKELLFAQLIPLKKCTEWLKCSKYDKFEFDSSHIAESKYILNYCNSYDSAINEVAVSAILNILDIVPILKQESLNYLIIFFSKSVDRFLNSDNWLEQHQDRDSIYCKFLEILSCMFLCWTKILECKFFIIYDKDKSLVPLVHCHSEFFHKSYHNSTLLQNGLKLISTAINIIIYKSVQYTDNWSIAFNELCNTLNNLLLDTRPEIRDSCLQCISNIVFENFFIKLILEKKLSIAVLNTFIHDNDPFVRSRALECLVKMVTIYDIWEAHLKESDLMTHCLNLMQYESEGIIRRQIVKLITAVYIHNELSDKLFDEICVIMVHITTKDPFWEVKTFAYAFWDSVIQNSIRNSSDPYDINHLIDNLNKLSVIGCLHVLYMALKEEYDLVVQKKAIFLAKELFVIVNLINNESDVDIKLKSESVNCVKDIDDNLETYSGSKQKKPRQINSADRILNSITTSSDCELLPSLKFAHKSSIYPDDICLYKKTDIYISAHEFSSFISTYNFNDYDVKTQWVISTRSGLDSMLDDIIGQSQNCFVDGADLLDCH